MPCQQAVKDEVVVVSNRDLSSNAQSYFEYFLNRNQILIYFAFLLSGVASRGIGKFAEVLGQRMHTSTYRGRKHT